jgi:hypothetical protein
MSDTSQGEGWWVASDGKWYPPEPTEEEKAESEIRRYLLFAEGELVRANKAGRLEAQTVHATRATAAATIALVIQGMRPEWNGSPLWP